MAGAEVVTCCENCPLNDFTEEELETGECSVEQSGLCPKKDDINSCMEADMDRGGF